MNDSMGYRYEHRDNILGGFQQDPYSEQLHVPLLRPSSRDMHYNTSDFERNGISMGGDAMNDPDYYKYNELMPEGPLPHFKTRSSQLNTDWHLPSGLFRPNRRETYHEEIHGPPSCRYNPEIYGNANISGRIRNHTSLADKGRTMKGAYNFYSPIDSVCPSNTINGVEGGYGTVFDGFSDGMQKTERRRINYGLERVPHSEEMLRNLVMLNAPMENTFPNRQGGSSTSYLSLGSLYNPELPSPYTHAGTGEGHYYANAGVSEVNPHFESYRPKWIGYQFIPRESGKSDSIMRFQQRELTENGIRMNTTQDNLFMFGGPKI